MKQFICTSILLLLMTSCSKSIKNTKWIGVGKHDDTELILKDNDGIIVNHYLENETDTFKITYRQNGNSVVISRHDDIVSVNQPGVLEGDTLKFDDGSAFVKRK